MRRILTALLFVYFGITICAAQSKKQISSDAMSGKWQYIAKEAPYGYETGTVNFINEKKEGKLNAMFIINGYQIHVKDIEKRENKYILKFNVEGSFVEVILLPKESVLTGKATVDGMTFSVSFNRSKE